MTLSVITPARSMTAANTQANNNFLLSEVMLFMLRMSHSSVATTSITIPTLDLVATSSMKHSMSSAARLIFRLRPCIELSEYVMRMIINARYIAA